MISTTLDLVSTSLTDIVNALENGMLDSEQLVRAYLDAIDKDNIHARGYKAIFESLERDTAFRIARQLDAERAQGNTRGPLHGIPIIVKDHMGTGPSRGLATTGGLAALGDLADTLLVKGPKLTWAVGTVCSEDSAVVQRLQEQGLISEQPNSMASRLELMIVLGKASMTVLHNMFYELPASPGPWNQILDNAVGAYDPKKPGGSSSGSAVSVAVGFAAASIGAETFGSIVNPASANALYALKPSVGLIPDLADGNLILSERFDSIGPMGKTAMDVALMMDAIVPPDIRQISYAKELSYIGNAKTIRVAAIDPDREIRRAKQGERAKVEAEERAIAQFAAHERIDMVDIEGEPEAAAKERLDIMVGDDSCLDHLDAMKTTLVADMYANLNRFLAGVIGTDIKDVGGLLHWHQQHPEVYADIGGMRGNCAQLERMAARKGDETDPLFQDAMFTVGKAKQEIADFMAAHKLDAIIGGLGLSLLPALCGAPICTVPVGIYPGRLKPQALFMVGQINREMDLLHLMSIAEEVFGHRVPAKA